MGFLFYKKHLVTNTQKKNMQNLKKLYQYNKNMDNLIPFFNYYSYRKVLIIILKNKTVLGGHQNLAFN